MTVYRFFVGSRFGKTEDSEDDQPQASCASKSCQQNEVEALTLRFQVKNSVNKFQHRKIGRKGFKITLNARNRFFWTKTGVLLSYLSYSLMMKFSLALLTFLPNMHELLVSTHSGWTRNNCGCSLRCCC
jgi:hypothetical protein